MFGVAAGLSGSVALVQAFRASGSRSLTKRLLLLTFGVAFVTFGVLHFSEGIGLQWTTPKLRSKLYVWFAVPCVLAWLFAWYSERRTHG